MQDSSHGGRTPYEAFTVYLIGAVSVLADQFVKFAIVTILTLGQSRPIVDGLFGLRYVQNFGVAFSMFWGAGGFLLLPAIAISLAIVVYQWRVRRTEPLVVAALGLILGGALGNLIDRATLGYVRDMFDLQWQGRNIFPIFNVADVSVNLGVGLFALQYMLQGRKPAKAPVRADS